MESIAVKLPDGTTATLRSSELDAYCVFEDLCLLANQERPNFLRLEALPKTFALELIESVLTNYHVLFHQASRSKFHNCSQRLTRLSAGGDGAPLTSPSQPITAEIIVRKTNLPTNIAIYKSGIHTPKALLS
jgi:hypothetical protein